MIESPARLQFEITGEQREIGELARTIAEREIAPHVAAWDREHRFPRELYSKLGEAGIMGLIVPERYGGAGADYVSYALAVEEFARVDAGTAVTLSVHLMIASAIVRLGDDAQKERYLPRLASGEAIAGFALTEPGAGSDAAALTSTARRESSARAADGRAREHRAEDGRANGSRAQDGHTGEDDDAASYVLNGRKQWCTNGSYAGVTMGMFRTGGPGAKGVSAFLIDNDTPGIVVEKVTEKLGIHTSNTCDLAFDDVRVPASALLGAEGTGFTMALSALGAGRIGIAAQATGILAACLDASVKFAQERETFGRPIAANQGVSFKIAQMATDLDAARLLVYRAASLCDRGEPFALEGSKAKLFASTAACKHAAEAVQIHGGYGYTTEFPVERYYRDAKITEIYEGTSEIQQIIIARSLLGRFD